MSNIEWTEVTWNPTVGCTEISAGCRDCYAAKMAWRIVHMKNKTAKDYEGTVKKLPNGKVVWTGKVNILQDRLLEPVRNKKPTTYFVDSMSDLFHEDLPFAFIDKVFAVMMLCPQHIFQVLTKRTDRMYEYMKSRQDFDYIDEEADIIICENYHLFHVVEKLSKKGQDMTGEKYMPSNEFLPHLKAVHWAHDITYSEHGKEHKIIYEGDWPAKHIWFGTSIENQKAADQRGESLYKLHQLGCVTWVSNEPAIGPVNWEEPFYFGFLDWMVTGGESGSTARPMHPDWVRASRDFCKKNNIPFFYKQNGQYTTENMKQAEPDYYINLKGKTIVGCDASYWIRNEAITKSGESKWIGIYKVGKHNSGRILDGKLHDQYPDLSKPKQQFDVSTSTI